MKIEILEGKSLRYELVGSRVTCDPAPTDTDQDVLVLTTAELWDTSLGAELGLTGFDKGGSDCGNQVDYLSQVPLSFQSFTKDDLNLIITFDPEFFRRFMAATAVAKSLNLMGKDERVMLFQAVLYGNEPITQQDFNIQTPPPVDHISAYWVESENNAGCVEAMNTEEARKLGAEALKAEIIECSRLPYPAQPRLVTHTHESWGVTPSFCYRPHQCKGRSSCPQNYSCTE